MSCSAPLFYANRTYARLIALVLAAALVCAACSGSDKHATGSTKSSPTVLRQGKLALTLGVVNIQNAGPPAKLPNEVRRTVLRNTQSYLNQAVLSPLERHGVNKAYQKLFDPFVKPAASKRDRAVLTEANPPLTRGVVNGRASRVRLDALGDQNGKVVLIAATFTLTVNASTKAGPLQIVRLTELTFQNEYGRWVIAAYRVSVRRTIGKAATTTTTAKSGPANTKGAAS